MASPAQRHMMRATAARVSALAAFGNPLANASGYELMLSRLAGDKRRLKAIQSIESKCALKRELLPEYAPWVEGVLSDGKGAQDDVFMSIMVWTIDAGDYAAALPMARYALQHKLTLPDQYQRTTATLLAEEIADAGIRAHDASESIDLQSLIQMHDLTEGEDMPDEVRAKLLKAIGYGLRAGKKREQACAALKRALQLHDKCGVKKDIERLEREIKNLAAGKSIR
ncbi:terminase endonuclease subunit [Craterilacuibacter sp. RT1T]|uniref:phage terminase small subunit n=1 Tax=Craterilacuibacter sp. RT1T TaxID=2942211 RepID=UPI0020C184D7|nr:terminase endonuclease subunit [Craterilacuibacter sp. RT1T]MCL6262189.1 terminase endonuclease subunit [Craterilacuibacter sp. RT1T]